MLAAITLSIYFGVSQTKAADLHVVQQTRDNDATLHAVPWHDYPGRAPIYYGIRLAYSLPNHPWTQFALDYTHLKVYANASQIVQQDGTWHGMPFSARAPIAQRVQSFEITHGLNSLGIVVLQQVSGSQGGGAYVGGGPVIYLPHSENRVDGIAGGDGYEYGGGGFEALAGARGCIGVQPVFSEVKYNHGSPTVSIAQGHAQTRVDVLQEIAGTGARRCPR